MFKNSLNIILILTVSYCFGESPPRTYTEFENYLSREKVITKRYQSSGSSETYVLVGITNPENGEATLYRSVVSGIPSYEWTVLLKDGFNFFDEPVKAISVSERNTRHIFILTEREEIYFTTDGGFSFVKSETLDFPKDKTNFVELVKDFELSSEFQSEKINPSKYTNQINNLPPYAPMLWDTILWDSTETLLTSNIPSGWLAFKHGRIEVDDSGFVHIAAVSQQEQIRYFRSTNYGESFEPDVVLQDSIGGVREVIVTGDNVYIYSINSIASTAQFINFYSSLDKGVTWNPVTLFPYGAHSGVTARSDTVYDYQESGAGGGIYQARSYDSGATFQPYEVVADSILASIQTPKVAVGGNSILLTRTGSESQVVGTNISRSYDLGNTWEPTFYCNAPTPCDQTSAQFPDVYFHSGKFHFVQGLNWSVYNRSDDFGNSFTPHWLLCLSIDGCSVDQQQQITAYKNNVFVTFVDVSDAPKDYLITRFSRDNGDNWSQVQLASQQAPTYLGIFPWYSTAADDSLFYVVYVDDSGNPFETLKLRFRRGFYKFPYLSFEPDTLKINSQFLPSQLNTNFTVRNKGVIDLEVSEIELPNWITLLSDSSFTLQPDSTKEIEIQLDFTQPLLEGELLFHTNQQIDSIRSFVVLVDTVVTDLEIKDNLPNKFSLSQNYPNPFNPTTVINYELGITNYEKATLTIFNILGEEVKHWQLISDNNSVVWNGTDNFGTPVSSGVYLYRLESGSFSKTKKMVLLK